MGCNSQQPYKKADDRQDQAGDILVLVLKYVPALFHDKQSVGYRQVQVNGKQVQGYGLVLTHDKLALV